MRTKLLPYEDELYLEIDKQFLEVLKITLETPLELTVEGRALIITPIHSDEDKQ